MKNILILILVLSTQAFTQNEIKSLYELKHQAIQQISSTTEFDESFVLNDDVKKKKNTGIAILYSLLLPGMGELYADAYDSGVYFTVADGVLWGTYIGMNVYGNWQKDRYISYA